LHYRERGDKRITGTKNEVLTIRTTAEVKAPVKLAVERERWSAASIVVILVLDYSRAYGLEARDEIFRP
jgi:hypothetical protein